MKTCTCGSGKRRWELKDAAGIFCGFICEDCKAEKKAKFNPRIFSEWYDADKPDVEFPRDR
jgi:hypothetical protein